MFLNCIGEHNNQIVVVGRENGKSEGGIIYYEDGTKIEKKNELTSILAGHNYFYFGDIKGNLYSNNKSSSLIFKKDFRILEIPICLFKP